MRDGELLEEIDRQRLLMIGEATGESRGSEAEIEYAERRERIEATLHRRNLDGAAGAAELTIPRRISNADG